MERVERRDPIMDLIEVIARRAGMVLYSRGNLRLVRYEDVERFLDACLQHNAVVLGIEGFTSEKGKLLVEMDAIADFSELTKSEESVCESKKFIEESGRSGMLFDFTLASN